MSARQAFVKCSAEYIRERLGLPIGTKLVNVFPDGAQGMVLLLVQHERLSEVPEGAPIPTVNLVLRHVESRFEPLQDWDK